MLILNFYVTLGQQKKEKKNATKFIFNFFLFQVNLTPTLLIGQES